MTQTLSKFIDEWAGNYHELFNQIGVLNLNLELNNQQLSDFVEIFGEVRSCMSFITWKLGSWAPDEKYKKIILGSVESEFGGTNPSHDQLFWQFRESVDQIPNATTAFNFLDYGQGVNIAEKVNDKYNLFFLSKKSWISKWAAFVALERLDSIEYSIFYKFAKKVFSNKKNADLTFFEVHANADHFELLMPSLQEMWDTSPDEVRRGFEFIQKTQLGLWNSVNLYFKHYDSRNFNL